MTIEDVKSILLREEYEDTPIFLNPDYADAFLGPSQDGRAVYDYETMIKCLIEEGMTREEAIEFIDYNTFRVIPYMGDKYPIILLS